MLVTDICDLGRRFLLPHSMALLIGTWVASAAASVIAYRQGTPPSGRSLRGWWTFCLPRQMLEHPSCRLDVVYAVLHGLIRLLVITPIVAGNLAIATSVYLGLAMIFGPQTTHEAGVFCAVAMVALCVVVHDGISFHLHYLDHKLRVLWEVHKVHHSIEFMLPVCSGRRVHPLEDVVNDSLCAAGVGVVLGSLSYALHLGVRDNLIAGVDAYFLVNALSFYHLRHSHIPLRYGRLERVLISPLQHHIHHSHEEQLRDKNFGTLFSIWDRLYGTIVYSEGVGAFRIGLAAEDGQSDYDRVWKLLVVPLRNIIRLAACGLQRPNQAALRARNAAT